MFRIQLQIHQSQFSWRQISQEAVTEMCKYGRLCVGPRGPEEMWVPRKGAKPNLGRDMTGESFQEEVMPELCFEGCVGVSQAGQREQQGPSPEKTGECSFCRELLGGQSLRRKGGER